MSKLLNCLKQNILEVGLDEVARGCLAGPVFASSVIWTKDILEKEKDNKILLMIKDSKKLKATDRKICSDYIKNKCYKWSISYVSEKRIDEINIRNASMEAMHLSLKKLNIKPEHIIVDGNYFKPYIYQNDENPIEYTTVVKGDSKYLSIASASILAKVARDEYMNELIKKKPYLTLYKWDKNCSYGTKEHLEAINKYGICEYHRKTFGICKKMNKIFTEKEYIKYKDTDVKFKDTDVKFKDTEICDISCINNSDKKNKENNTNIYHNEDKIKKKDKDNIKNIVNKFTKEINIFDKQILILEEKLSSMKKHLKKLKKELKNII